MFVKKYTMQFKSGFEYKGFRFGWFEGELYRLPESFKYNNDKIRNYSLKKIPITTIYKTKKGIEAKGYRCATDKLSIQQIKGLTEKVNWSLNETKDKNFPH